MCDYKRAWCNKVLTQTVVTLTYTFLNSIKFIHVNYWTFTAEVVCTVSHRSLQLHNSDILPSIWLLTMSIRILFGKIWNFSQHWGHFRWDYLLCCRKSGYRGESGCSCKLNFCVVVVGRNDNINVNYRFQMWKRWSNKDFKELWIMEEKGNYDEIPNVKKME